MLHYILPDKYQKKITASEFIALFSSAQNFLVESFDENGALRNKLLKK